MFDFDKLRDAVKAFRYVLEGEAVVYGVKIEGKLDLTRARKSLVKQTTIEPAQRRGEAGGSKGVD